MPRLLLALLLSLALTGCASRLDPYRVGLTVATSAYQATDAAWARAKAVERDACLVPPTPPAESPACVEGVIARWAPRAAAVESLHAALLVAGEVLAILELQELAKLPLELPRIERAIAAVLAAAQAVQAVR